MGLDAKAHLLGTLGRYKEAIAVYDEFLTRFNPSDQFLRGIASINRSRWAAAVGKRAEILSDVTTERSVSERHWTRNEDKDAAPFRQPQSSDNTAVFQHVALQSGLSVEDLQAAIRGFAKATSGAEPTQPSPSTSFDPTTNRLRQAYEVLLQTNSSSGRWMQD